MPDNHLFWWPDAPIVSHSHFFADSSREIGSCNLAGNLTAHELSLKTRQGRHFIRQRGRFFPVRLADLNPSMICR